MSVGPHTSGPNVNNAVDVTCSGGEDLGLLPTSRVRSFRVTLVISSFAPLEGGAERQLRLVFSRLVALGDTVTVVTLRQPGCLSREMLSGMTVIRRGVSTRSKLRRVTNALRMILAVSRSNPDVIVSSQLGAATLSAFASSRINHVPHVIRLAGGSAIGPEAFARSQSFTQRLVLSRLVARAAFVVSPAAHLLSGSDPITSAFEPIASVIPNGVSMPSNRAEAEGCSPVDVIWVGRNDPVKGVDDLLKIACRCPQLTFLALGLEPTISTPDNLECLGRVSNVADRMPGAKVFLTTSRFEGSPNAALEALAMGVPVIGYDIAGLQELEQRYGDAVTLSPFGDLGALEAQLRKLVERPRKVNRQPPTVDDVAPLWRNLLERARS